MAWNPSPQVQVARDAAKQLGQMAGSPATHCVIVYLTDNGQAGYVSYGSNPHKCAQARNLADRLYERTVQWCEEMAH